MTDARAPYKVRDHTSQPWKLKPNGCPGSAGSRLRDSSQKRGSAFVKSPGNAMTTARMVSSTADARNNGLRRSCFHASRHWLAGVSSTWTESTAARGVSSAGAT